MQRRAMGIVLFSVRSLYSAVYICYLGPPLRSGVCSVKTILSMCSFPGGKKGDHQEKKQEEERQRNAGGPTIAGR